MINAALGRALDRHAASPVDSRSIAGALRREYRGSHPKRWKPRWVEQVGDFTKAFVDAVYAKLLVVESLDTEGNVVRRERRRMAIAAMGDEKLRFKVAAIVVQSAP